MVDLSFLPTLSDADIQRAAQLIQQAYNSANQASPEDIKRFQHDLSEIQKLDQAWGLVVPLLNHADEHVQFFGAHTAQLKINRDWDSFPSQHYTSLRDLLVQLTAHSIVNRKSKVVLRKLFVVLSALALRLVPRPLNAWPDWILFCVTTFSGAGASTTNILEFLMIVVEEVGSANLAPGTIGQMNSSLQSAIPMLASAITTSIRSPGQNEKDIEAALKCFKAWIPQLPSDYLTPLVPHLISLLNTSTDTIFIASSDGIQELLSSSPFSTGAAYATLTEPLLVWVNAKGSAIVQTAIQAAMVDEVTLSLTKLLADLGEHSTNYLAKHVVSNELVSSGQISKGQLIQNFLRILLSLSSFPGYFGIDEEISDLCLSFWYLFQEALWNPNDSPTKAVSNEDEKQAVVKRLYVQVVKALRVKGMWPSPGHNWSKDQVNKFQVYRRDVGDTLLNAYYVLRDDMLLYLIDDVIQRLAARNAGRTGNGMEGSWEEIEASLHCLESIQEAIDYTQTPQLGRLFDVQVVNQMPQTGHGRARRCFLGLISTYASWFTAQPPSLTVQNQLQTAVGYTISALPDPNLSLVAGNALRNLCDSNRKMLAPHLSAFAELHAGIGHVPNAEKSKVMESIASVIQALTPQEQISAVEAMINPIIQALAETLAGVNNILPDEARSLTILHLETLGGVVKGLTRTEDSSPSLHSRRQAPDLEIVDLDEDLFSLEFDLEELKIMEDIQTARLDPRMVAVRDRILQAVARVVEIWGDDVSVGLALTTFLTSITSLPSDATLISLTPTPLLSLACHAIRPGRAITPAWITLFGTLFVQLFPQPPKYPQDNPEMKAKAEKVQWDGRTQQEMKAEAIRVVGEVLPVLLGVVLALLGADAGLATHPDIVQAFFTLMEQLASIHVNAFYNLPPGGLDALMQGTTQALVVQERYAQVAVCGFMTKFIVQSYNTTDSSPSLVTVQQAVTRRHGRNIIRAILAAIVGAVPRSCMPNIVGLFTTVLSKWMSECKVWIREILDAPDFPSSKATPEAKDRFVRGVLGSKSNKRTTEAVQNFALVARGLEGSGFGWAASG